MKKYKTIKELPFIEIGSVFEWNVADNCYFCHYNDASGDNKYLRFDQENIDALIKSGWLELINDSIELKFVSESKDYLEGIKGNFLTNENLRFINEAIVQYEKIKNGELFTKTDMLDFGLRVFDKPPLLASSWHDYLDNWIKLSRKK